MNYPVGECITMSCGCTDEKKCHDCEIRNEGYEAGYKEAKDKYLDFFRGICFSWIVYIICDVLFKYYL